MGIFRLSSITLEGFKSFAGRVELTFPAPITAIVGPNGSGKSNICDGIAWVLGEQSAKSLRSQTMADVVFAGAQGRQPAGSAEVQLVLTASDGRWEGSDGRLEISRRVLRDGPSEYRMGGRRSRLKDIADQLMDAGLGTRAYAIIEQGRIGQVLSARATDRRALFEEAAGITKFRVRRHEAELKLAETRANLVRLDDVATEVRRALESARRQARRAERHHRLRHELAEVRARLFALRRSALTAALAARQAELVDAEAAESAAAGDLARAETALVERRREQEAAQERLAGARAEEAQLDAVTQRREAEEAAARRELEDASSRRDASAADVRRFEAAAAELEAGRGVLVTAVEDTGQAADRARAAAAEAAGVAADMDAVAQKAAAQHEEARRALLAAAAAANEARNRLHRTEVELEQAGYQRTRLAAEKERLAAHLQQVVGKEEEAEESRRLAERRSGESERRAREIRDHLAELESRAAAATAKRDRVAHQRWQARHELEGLERALAAARALPHVLTRAVPEEKILGTVSDLLDPDTDVAALLDRAYGDLLTLPVLADDRALADLRSQLSDADGSIEVVVADTTADPRPSPLLEKASAKPPHLGWLTRALPRAVIADDEESAARIAADDPDLLVVLRDGTRRHGRRLELPGKRHTAQGVLGLRDRARKAAAREHQAGDDEAALVAELEGIRAEQSQQAQALAEAEATAKREAQASATATSAHESVHRERSRLERELEALSQEEQRLESEAAEIGRQLDTARAEVERLAARAAELEGALETIAADAERARDEAGAARAAAERSQGAAAVIDERLLAARRELEHHAREVASLREREEAARAEEAAQRRRAEEATAAASRARADLATFLAQKTAVHKQGVELAEAAERLRADVQAADTVAEEKRSVHMAARDGAHAARLAVSEARAAVDRLAETVALTLGPDVALPEETPGEDELPSLEENEQRLAGALEALGPVNELAVAERDELEERHTFLREQRRDLEKALESLNGTVRELDETCTERFVTTLEETATAFDTVFRELFGGGEATVELSDPDNPLESGVEIRVRPPGKHNQSVLLLSGGEKALAAVALLLALFRIRPAPFCVLDEVDAPLDDANVERLCRLLREMSTDTQFLLVTHNRRTMSHADVLYGVTMNEPGVSRIVSVRLE